MGLKIHRNLGVKDRIIRSILAVYILSMAVSMNIPFWGAAALGVLGAALLLEAITAY